MIRPGRRDCLLPGPSPAGSLTGIGRRGSWHLRDGERHCGQRAGHFAFVVGVDRVGQAEELLKHGADIVVKDLAELLD